MKKLFLASALVALVFGFNAPTANAQKGPSSNATTLNGAEIFSEFDNESGILTIETHGDIKVKDRLAVSVTHISGERVYYNKINLGRAGFKIQVDLNDAPDGTFYLKVRGRVVAHANRFDKR